MVVSHALDYVVDDIFLEIGCAVMLLSLLWHECDLAALECGPLVALQVVRSCPQTGEENQGLE